jgi:hypothetical protein
MCAFRASPEVAAIAVAGGNAPEEVATENRLVSTLWGGLAELARYYAELSQEGPEAHTFCASSLCTPPSRHRLAQNGPPLLRIGSRCATELGLCKLE